MKIADCRVKSAKCEARSAKCDARLPAAIFALLLVCVPVFAADEDDVTDVQEQKSYVKGAYTEGAEGDTLNVKKGEGFDFKIPEIIITGQIDTKVLLKRETTSLEDLQNVKNVLYEKERLQMPYSYLREEELAPQNEDKARARDFVGKIKLLGGTYSNFLASGILGKAFDGSNSVVLRITHQNTDNDRINDKLTYKNLNSGELFYTTAYGGLEAIYTIKGAFDRHGNPYPYNIFGSYYNMQDYEAGLSLSGDINSFGFDGAVNYVYFDERSRSGFFLYKENRLELAANIEKDFAAGQEKKVKTMLSISGWYSDVGAMPYKNSFNFDLVFKGIFYFEPVVFQGGFLIQDYNADKNHYRMSPYLAVNFDVLPALSIYADFKPKMQVTDNTELLRTHFTKAAVLKQLPVENVNLRTGAQLNLFEAFFDIFYGYKKISSNAYLDARVAAAPDDNDCVFSYSSNDLEYNYAGISVETLKLKNIKIKLDYEYKNIIEQSAPTTYMPNNILEAKFIYQPAEWEFILAPVLMSSQIGASNRVAGAYASVDFSVSRKITENFTVTGFVNNLLNNNYYLLYYYSEKKLNLGAAITLKF